MGASTSCVYALSFTNDHAHHTSVMRTLAEAKIRVLTATPGFITVEGRRVLTLAFQVPVEIEKDEPIEVPVNPVAAPADVHD